MGRPLYKTKARGENVMWAIILRYGLADGNMRTYGEIGAMLGVSKESVRQYLRAVSDFQALCKISIAITERLLDQRLKASMAEEANLVERKITLEHIINLIDSAKTDGDAALIRILLGGYDARRGEPTP